MITEEYNDDMHRIIVERLGERNRKMEIIRGYERSKNRRRVFSFIGLLMAACLVGVVFMIDINSLTEPADEAVRSSLGSAQELIEQGRYDEALSVVERELYVSDSTLRELSKEEITDDDERGYEVKALKVKIKELHKERAALKKILE